MRVEEMMGDICDKFKEIIQFLACAQVDQIQIYIKSPCHLE